MGEGSYSNFKPFEGTLTGEITLDFPWRPRAIQIINDSPTKTLLYKFNDTEDWGTLNGGETVSYSIIVRNVILSGTAVSYRVWGVG